MILATQVFSLHLVDLPLFRNFPTKHTNSPDADADLVARLHHIRSLINVVHPDVCERVSDIRLKRALALKKRTDFRFEEGTYVTLLAPKASYRLPSGRRSAKVGKLGPVYEGVY